MVLFQIEFKKTGEMQHLENLFKQNNPKYVVLCLGAWRDTKLSPHVLHFKTTVNLTTFKLNAFNWLYRIRFSNFYKKSTKGEHGYLHQ